MVLHKYIFSGKFSNVPMIRRMVVQISIKAVHILALWINPLNTLMNNSMLININAAVSCSWLREKSRVPFFGNAGVTKYTRQDSLSGVSSAVKNPGSCQGGGSNKGVG